MNYGIDFPQIAPSQLPSAPAGMFGRKPSFFGEGGTGRGIAGAIGDFLLQSSGMRPLYAPAMQMQQARQQELSDREAQMKQWMAQEQWKRANPAPVAPHFWETNDGSLGMVGPDGKPRVVYKDPTPKVTWTQVDLPNGQKQLIPSINGQLMGGASPMATPGANPPSTLPPDFDFGGPTQPASGGFR